MKRQVLLIGVKASGVRSGFGLANIGQAQGAGRYASQDST